MFAGFSAFMLSKMGLYTIERKNKSGKKSAEKTSIFFRKNPDTIPIKIKRRNGT